MKTWPVFAALLVLGAAPTQAQQTQAQQSSDALEKSATIRGEMDILELEQEVDKQFLREAMTTVLRGRINPRGTDEARNRNEAGLATLEEFIQLKKRAVVERAVELKRKAAELFNATKSTALPKMNPPNPPASPAGTRRDEGEKALIEELEEAQLEAQLLQKQVELYQSPLNEAMQALADAEFAASNDESQRDKADAARKRYEKAREKFLGFSKKLQLEQSKVGELQQRRNFRGMGGGFQ